MSASILVADDEPNIVLSLEFLLKQAGFRVRTVSDGEAALAAIAQEPPDLLLLDVMIPGRDGYAGARRHSRAKHRANQRAALDPATSASSLEECKGH